MKTTFLQGLVAALPVIDPVLLYLSHLGSMAGTFVGLFLRLLVVVARPQAQVSPEKGGKEVKK